MKFISLSVTSSLLVLLGQQQHAQAQEDACAAQARTTDLVPGILTMTDIVDPVTGTLNVQLTLQDEAWMALGIPSSSGQMIGAEAVIGGVDGIVQKYALQAKSVTGVVPLPSQTLLDATFEQANGVTTVSYKKLLTEDGELAISSEAGATQDFIYAYGSDNVLGYHGGRGSISLPVVLCSAATEATTTEAPSPATPIVTEAPSSAAVSSIVPTGFAPVETTEAPSSATVDTAAPSALVMEGGSSPTETLNAFEICSGVEARIVCDGVSSDSNNDACVYTPTDYWTWNVTYGVPANNIAHDLYLNGCRAAEGGFCVADCNSACVCFNQADPDLTCDICVPPPPTDTTTTDGGDSAVEPVTAPGNETMTGDEDIMMDDNMTSISNETVAIANGEDGMTLGGDNETSAVEDGGLEEDGDLMGSDNETDAADAGSDETDAADAGSDETTTDEPDDSTRDVPPADTGSSASTLKLAMTAGTTTMALIVTFFF